MPQVVYVWDCVDLTPAETKGLGALHEHNYQFLLLELLLLLLR
jgi:hypothetical protein